MSIKSRFATRKGVTSIYVVIFATILFGVITVSFTRVILSEVQQSSQDDLSRSAYDAALAGVEDAKIAINRYYECLSKNQETTTDAETGKSNCTKYNVFSTDNSCESGFPLAKVLHNVSSGEVLVQESSDSTTGAENDQAYTCVLISDITPDYRGTLTSDTRTRIVPIGLGGISGSGSAKLGSLSKIRFSWYSELNQGTGTELSLRTNAKLPNAAKATTPPTIQLTFLRTAGSFKLSSFHTDNNADGNIYSSFVLIPSKKDDEEGSTVTNTIDADGVQSAGNADTINVPYQIECAAGREFACYVDLDVDEFVSAGDNVLLMPSMPYGDAYTDFAVTLFDSSGGVIEFSGAQISVDSTGRTNQLFRRVEVRLDPADLFFPYPQYALEVTSSEDDSIKKNFWITTNCWTENGVCAANGDA